MPKKLSEISKSVRQQKIFNILRHHTEVDEALPISEIHARLIREDIQTCQKTIQRDLIEMSSTHKIESTDGKPSRYFCSNEYEPDYQLTFSESELTTLALALRSLKEMSDDFQRSLCEKTETILLSKLPREIASDFEKLKAFTIVSPGLRAVTGQENGQGYSLILKALQGQRVIECTNHSPYQSKTNSQIIRRFSPLKLNMVGGEQYLLVHDHRDGIIKRLKVCRMSDIRILETKIDPQLLSKVDDLSASIGGFGGPEMEIRKYAIHCDELMATLFKEKKFHPSQKIETSGENYIITFETNPSIEIARYFSGWAKHIRRVEPEETYREIQDIWHAGLELSRVRKAA